MLGDLLQSENRLVTDIVVAVSGKALERGGIA
jgi:hypothetical protein